RRRSAGTVPRTGASETARGRERNGPARRYAAAARGEEELVQSEGHGEVSARVRAVKDAATLPVGTELGSEIGVAERDRDFVAQLVAELGREQRRDAEARRVTTLLHLRAPREDHAANLDPLVERVAKRPA